MNYEEAIKILQPEPENVFEKDACIQFLPGSSRRAQLMLGLGLFQLDGEFTLKELEAIVTLGLHFK